jgi:predicted protein tyrosine phosphatase
MHIHVCPLAAVDDLVAAHDPSHLLTLLGPEGMIAERPGLAAGRHLRIAVNDVTEPGEGMVLADAGHIGEIIGFATSWDRSRPMVIHCWAGISRSTAAAFIALSALNPDVPEPTLARRLREAAPFAKPNLLLVALADEAMGRGGRMRGAIDALPETDFVSIGRPFRLAAVQAP